MKKFIVAFLAILFVALITGCSSPSDEHYNPVVIDNTNLLPDSLRQTFSKFQFPKGVLPILVMDGSIGDLLKTGVQADDLFDELEDQYAQYDFDDFGVLIYITQEPQLMQVRLGSFYEAFGDLCGVTTGYDYFTNQQLYVNGYSNTALENILESISKNIEERNDLNWWQRGQLSGVQVSISDLMEWFGSPSKNFYGTMVAKPVYDCISYGSKFFGSWFWGIVIAFAIILFVKWLFSKLLKVIIPWENVRNIVDKVILNIIGYIYSISAAGCAMLLSSGRLEDLYAIKAFKVPNVESFIADPTMFVQDSNIWMAGIFVFLTGFSVCMGFLTNEFVQISLLPYSDQMKIWNRITSEKQKALLDWNGVEVPIKDDETPFEAISTKLSEKLGEKLGETLGFISIAALFFFPKAVLWTGIAFFLTKILIKIPRLKKNLGFKKTRHKGGRTFIGSFVALILFFTVVDVGLGWIIDPFNRKKDTTEQVLIQQRQVEVTSKKANLRTGPGTNYDIATVNEDGSGGKWQVFRGDVLNLVAEENGWYKVTVDGDSREVFIKKSLCQEIILEGSVEEVDEGMEYDGPDGLLASLPIGKTYYSGNMGGFSVELIIIINDKSGSLKAIYKNVRYHTTINLEGESLPAMGGDISFLGRDNKNNNWSFELSGDVNHIKGTAYGDNKQFAINLNKVKHSN